MQGNCVTEFHSFHSPSKRESTPDPGRQLERWNKRVIIWVVSLATVKTPLKQCSQMKLQLGFFPETKKRHKQKKIQNITNGWKVTVNRGRGVIWLSKCTYSSSLNKFPWMSQAGGIPRKTLELLNPGIQVEFLKPKLGDINKCLPFGGIEYTEL